MGDADVARVMARLDSGGDGTVSYDEFLVFWELNLSLEALLDCDIAALVRGNVQRAQSRGERGHHGAAEGRTPRRLLQCQLTATRLGAAPPIGKGVANGRVRLARELAPSQ